MADEPESAEHGDEGEVEVDIESFETSTKNTNNFVRRNKGQWSPQEIKIFEKGLELFGHKWTKIADLLETRTAAQVKSFSRKFFKQKELDESESLILISALTSSQLHLKMEDTNEVVDVDDSVITQTKESNPSRDACDHKMESGLEKPFDLPNKDRGTGPNPVDCSNKCDDIETRTVSSPLSCISRDVESPSPKNSACKGHISNENDTRDLPCGNELYGDADIKNEIDQNGEDIAGKNFALVAEVKHNINKCSSQTTECDDSCTGVVTEENAILSSEAACNRSTAKESVDNGESCQSVDSSKGKRKISCNCIINGTGLISSFDLERNDLHPVVSVEKLESTGIVTNKQLKENTSSLGFVYNVGDTRVRGNSNVRGDPEVKGDLESSTDSKVVKTNVKAHANELFELRNNIAEKDDETCEKDILALKKETINAGCSEAVSSLRESASDESRGSLQERCTGTIECLSRKEDRKPTSFENSESTVNSAAVDACASDIIPKDEATKICDALLRTLSPAVTDVEPEDKFIVSIKLDKLNKRIQPRRASRASTRRLSYAFRQQGRLSRRNKDVRIEVANNSREEAVSEDEISKKEVSRNGNPNEEGVEEIVSKNEESKKIDSNTEDPMEEPAKKECVDINNERVKCLDDQDDIKKRKKSMNKYKSLPKRTTRHSRPIQEDELPEKLIVSISLEDIDSYCQSEDKPACLLSTHTYSEGWMVQEDFPKSERNKQFCIDDIFVDKKAFGVMKYRTVGDNGEVKERLEILESRVAPANYVWPKDEDGRETGRLMVPDMKEAMRSIEEAKEKIADKETIESSKEGIKESGSMCDGREDSKELSTETTQKTDTYACKNKEKEVKLSEEGIVIPQEKEVKEESRAIESTQTCKVDNGEIEGEIEGETTTGIGNEAGDAKSSKKDASGKRNGKQARTMQKSQEKVVKKERVTRKTRSQTHKDYSEVKIESVDVDDENVENITGVQKSPSHVESAVLQAGEKSVKSASKLDGQDSSENEVAKRTSVENVNETIEITSISPSDGVITVESSAKLQNLEQIEQKPMSEATASQEPMVINSRKPGRAPKRRRKGNDVTPDGDAKKVLRPRRGTHQPDKETFENEDESTSSTKEPNQGNEDDVVKQREVKGKRVCKALQDVDGLTLKTDNELDSSNIKDILFASVDEERNSDGHERKDGDKEDILQASNLSTIAKTSGKESGECVLSDGSSDMSVEIKLKGKEEPSAEFEKKKASEDMMEDKKAKNHEVKSNLVNEEKNDVEIDSFNGSPMADSTSFQEDFNDMDRSSVNTTMMNSIATSLNSELFGMPGCDLEFTLPGMSKDVLVKRNANVVKSNVIEDCLRLPPVDKKGEMEDNADLRVTENAMLDSEMRRRQALLPDDMQMECLSPYGDTSKFFQIEEDNNEDFQTGQCQRIDGGLEGADAFLNGDDAESPFRQTQAEVGLKQGNRSQIAELLDDPFMNSDELRSSNNPDDSLLPEVENFTENNMQNSPCDDDKYDIPDSQFDNVDLPTEGFECEQELAEAPSVNLSYAKETSEGYSSGSSTDEDDDEDEDSDSSESDTDSSSSSSSRSDDDDDDDEDTEEESETSDSESDVNEEIRNDESFMDDISKSDVPSSPGDVSKEQFVPVKVEEVVFQDGEILPIERKECREFFMGKLSKTPEKYLNIRKFIIKEWNKIRPAYLTKNSIRSKVDPTDANAVGRVFMFLENFGAINVGCSVKNKWVERMERRRVKYFNAKRTENVEGQADEPKRKKGRLQTCTKASEKREVFLDFNVILEEERRANPQFFNGNKNKSPEKYLKMRNSIINCWMDSKPAYLTKQAARMAMSWYCGDVNAISRVHDYLEQIGAINFGCAQEPRRGRPSRARMNQDRAKSGPKSKECKREKEKIGDIRSDSKAARMRDAQKKLEDISREVEMEIGKPMIDCETGPYQAYNASIIQRTNLPPDAGNDLALMKPKSKRGRKPKIRQCEPDSTVHDENLLSEKESVRAPKNGLIPVKEIWESGPASDKSSVGDSGFDSVSEISPLLESDPGILNIKPSLVQDANLASLEYENDEGNYPMPTAEKILDMSMITEEEKLGCPEFFVGSRVKPPEKYVKIRDSILRSWHSKKPFYLNKHNARCDMPWYTGDINSIGRVHAYLERIGAINYGAVHRPKRSGRVPMCRKRKHTDSPRYEAPSPETEEDEDDEDDDDEMSDKMIDSDICNDDVIAQEKNEAFKRFLSEGNCIRDLPNSPSTVRDVMSEMWAKCKQKYLAKPSIHRGYTEDFVNDDEPDDDNDSDTGDESFVDDRAVMNGTYSETGKNGVWDMSKTFSLGLRPRKRWKMDINQDWIDRTESEGFTIKHLSPDEERMESRARPLSFASKLKKSLPESDPYKLVPCRTFPSESAQPFTVTMCLKALLVMDFHSHLSSSEVIGLVGGKYYHATRRLEIMRVAPCSNVGTNLQCEMDPVSQAKASNDLAQHGLDVVGWYHSHPTFAPTPSLRDIDTQSTFQEWFSRAGAPFVGIIISPYNMNSNDVPHRSQITCLTISDQWDESKSYRIPYMFKFKTEDLDKTDSFEDTKGQLKETMQTVDGCKKYLCQARLGNTPPGLLLLKSFEAKLNRKTSKKDMVLSQVRDLIGI